MIMLEKTTGIYTFRTDAPTSLPCIILKYIPKANTIKATAFIKSGDNHNFLKAIFKICVINHDPNMYHLLYVYQYASRYKIYII